MRLQPVGLPDAVDGRWRTANRRRHSPQAPVRFTGWPRLQRPADRVGDLIVADLPGCTRPRLVVEPIQPQPSEALAPFANRAPENPQPLGDQAVVPTFGRRQHNTRSQGQRLSSRTPARQRFQFPSLFRANSIADALPFAILTSSMRGSDSAEFLDQDTSFGRLILLHIGCLRRRRSWRGQKRVHVSKTKLRPIRAAVTRAANQEAYLSTSPASLL